MRMSAGLQLSERILGTNKSVEALAIEIVDILRARDEQDYSLTEKDIFILGLRYAEFFDEDPTVASMKQQIYLNKLGIDEKELYECEESIWRSIRDNC